MVLVFIVMFVNVGMIDFLDLIWVGVVGNNFYIVGGVIVIVNSGCVIFSYDLLDGFGVNYCDGFIGELDEIDKYEMLLVNFGISILIYEIVFYNLFLDECFFIVCWDEWGEY